MSDEPLTARQVVVRALGSGVDIEEPVQVRLGLWDDRTVSVIAHTAADGHYVLTLAEHDAIDAEDYQTWNQRRRAKKAR